MSRTLPRLAGRLLAGQVPVVLAGAVIPVAVAALVGPQLFHVHLSQAGVADADAVMHAEEAFQSALAIAVTVGAVAALVVAGLVSWLLVQRISAPIERLAQAADRVADGDFSIPENADPFSEELASLDRAFTSMAERLAQTDASRTRLLADLAHELRTPLATLQAYIDGLEDGVIGADSAAWGTMRLQVDRLRRLASDVREVAAAEEHALGLERRPLDLRNTVDAAAAAARPRYAAKPLHLSVQVPATRVLVTGDEMRLQQVLTNLLENALRHTAAGGHVAIMLEQRDGLAELCVRDDGEGIPADQLEAVFERFHRLDPARAGGEPGGSGLGLTIVRALVRDHGGTITAHSAGSGCGTTFRVVLPLASDGS